MTYVERLVAIYMRSRSRLLDEISKRKLWGRSTWQQEGMLKLIDDEIARLNKETALWTEDAIKRTYMYGALSVWQAAYEKDKRVKAFGSFGGLHKRAIGILTHNTQDFLRITNSLIARQAQDTVRQIGVEVTSAKFAENLTVRETAKLMEKRLKEEGFYATVPWRNGKGSMRTDSYAELVARTTTAEATNTGTLNQMEEMGYVLFKMTAHNTTCKVCASRQGRVYRTVEENELPENDPRRKFPHISEALPRWPEYRTVHPNCAHRILAFIWDQKSKKEQDAALKDANKPFDVDPRSEAERKRYEEIQRKNRERLRDRKQWEKYRAVLGNKNVPNFSGFRAMKKANSDRYQELRALYYKTNRENAIIEAAKKPDGRHSGKYNDAAKWSDKSVKRAAKSYRKTAEEHQAKIANPAKYDKNWDKKTPIEKQGLLNKWEKDYTRNDELRIIMEKILKERGIDIE